LNPLSKMLTCSTSTPSSGASMPRWLIDPTAVPPGLDFSSGSLHNAGPIGRVPPRWPPFQSSWRVFFQPRDNLIDFLAPDDHVLSQHPGQHLPNLLQAHTPPLDQADTLRTYSTRRDPWPWAKLRLPPADTGKFPAQREGHSDRPGALPWQRSRPVQAHSRCPAPDPEPRLRAHLLGLLSAWRSDPSSSPDVLVLVIGDTPQSGLSLAVSDTAP